jgi:dephospho-CoA kinase
VIVACVTGGIASGKSTLVREWERLGARTLDADRVGWALLSRAEVRESLLYAFGPDILADDGEVDRARLAARAFADAESAETLNAILHPPILAEIARWIAEERAAARTGVAVVEASLIMEAGRRDLFDVVVLVTSRTETRLARLAARGVAREDALARMGRQWTDDAKRPLADFVVENDGTPEDLARAAHDLWRTISALPPRTSRRAPEGGPSGRENDEKGRDQ